MKRAYFYIIVFFLVCGLSFIIFLGSKKEQATFGSNHCGETLYEFAAKLKKLIPTVSPAILKSDRLNSNFTLTQPVFTIQKYEYKHLENLDVLKPDYIYEPYVSQHFSVDRDLDLEFDLIPSSETLQLIQIQGVPTISGKDLLFIMRYKNRLIGMYSKYFSFVFSPHTDRYKQYLYPEYYALRSLLGEKLIEKAVVPYGLSQELNRSIHELSQQEIQTWLKDIAIKFKIPSSEFKFVKFDSEGSPVLRVNPKQVLKLQMFSQLYLKGPSFGSYYKLERNLYDPEFAWITPLFEQFTYQLPVDEMKKGCR